MRVHLLLISQTASQWGRMWAGCGPTQWCCLGCPGVREGHLIVWIVVSSSSVRETLPLILCEVEERRVERLGWAANPSWLNSCHTVPYSNNRRLIPPHCIPLLPNRPTEIMQEWEESPLRRVWTRLKPAWSREMNMCVCRPSISSTLWSKATRQHQS